MLVILKSITPPARHTMITDHSQMGRLTTAYTLLANIPLRVTEKGGMIIIHSPHYNVDEQFTSEYNAIMWLHKEIASVVATDIAWLTQHEEAFNGKDKAVRTESDK